MSHSHTAPDHNGRHKKKRKAKPAGISERNGWGECDNCGQYLPIVAEVGMCGPCTFGEADTLYGF